MKRKLMYLGKLSEYKKFIHHQFKIYTYIYVTIIYEYKWFVYQLFE